MKKILSLILCLTTILFGFYNINVFAGDGVVFNASTGEKKIALTFDDGGPYSNVKEILDILDSENVKATFFLIGSWMANNPLSVKEISNRNHEIGSHSYYHKNLKYLSDKEITEDLQQTQDVFKNITGRDMDPYIRPPYGSYSEQTEKVILDMGYHNIVLWNIDTYDWKKVSKSSITNTVLSQARPGSIALMHLTGKTNTAKALPGIIKGLKEQGYSIVTVSELLNDNIVQTYVKQDKAKERKEILFYRYFFQNLNFTKMLENILTI